MHTHVCLCVGGNVCTSVRGAVSVRAERGTPRFASQATLISCVTLGKLFNFSEPKLAGP